MATLRELVNVIRFRVDTRGLTIAERRLMAFQARVYSVMASLNQAGLAPIIPGAPPPGGGRRPPGGGGGGGARAPRRGGGGGYLTAAGLAADRTADSFQRVGRAARVAAAFGAVYFGISAVRGLIGTNIEMQRLQAGLETVLQSEARAHAAFQYIIDFSMRTPFLIGGVTDAYIRLLQAGLEPTEARLMALGNIAASTGHDIGDIVTGILDTIRGHTRGLEGVLRTNISKRGGRIFIDFRGRVIEVENSVQALTAALEELGRNEFAGGVQRQMGRLPGIVANFKDSITRLSLRIGEAMNGPLGQFLQTLEALFLRGQGALMFGRVVGGAFRVLGSVLRAIAPVMRHVGMALSLLTAFFVSRLVVSGILTTARALLRFGLALATLRGIFLGLIPTAVFLIFEDFLVFLRNGRSLIGRFAKQMQNATGPLGRIARFLLTIRRGFQAGDFGVFDAFGRAVEGTIGDIWEHIKGWWSREAWPHIRNKWIRPIGLAVADSFARALPARARRLFGIQTAEESLAEAGKLGPGGRRGGPSLTDVGLVVAGTEVATRMLFGQSILRGVGRGLVRMGRGIGRAAVGRGVTGTVATSWRSGQPRSVTRSVGGQVVERTVYNRAGEVVTRSWREWSPLARGLGGFAKTAGRVSGRLLPWLGAALEIYDIANIIERAEGRTPMENWRQREENERRIRESIFGPTLFGPQRGGEGRYGGLPAGSVSSININHLTVTAQNSDPHEIARVVTATLDKYARDIDQQAAVATG